MFISDTLGKRLRALPWMTGDEVLWYRGKRWEKGEGRRGRLGTERNSTEQVDLQATLSWPTFTNFIYPSPRPPLIWAGTGTLLKRHRQAAPWGIGNGSWVPCQHAYFSRQLPPQRLSPSPLRKPPLFVFPGPLWDFRPFPAHFLPFLFTCIYTNHNTDSRDHISN